MRHDLGRVGVWGHLDSLPIDRLRAYVHAVEDLGFGAMWVPETVGREPFTLLALVADSTRSLMLGTSIASVYARDAVTTRVAAMTLHEATADRFVLGLGVSHPHLVTKLRGHDYIKPVTAMRDYLADYRRAPYKGPVAGGATRPEPPVLLGALRERMVTLAATDAGGAFPYLVTVDRIAWMRGILDAAAPSGRPLLCVTMPVVLEPDPATAMATARAYLVPYLRTPNYQASFAEQGFDDSDWQPPGSDRLVESMVAAGPLPALMHRLDRYLAAGADHVAIIPLAADGATEHLPTLQAMAAILEP
ncbi:MAG: LLM class flavin-dependent oxidoreductase [Candidatus Limnocylindrales bacterium]